VKSPTPIRQNAKPFKFTESVLQEAFDANDDLGNVFTKLQIRADWTLARSLVAAGMRADGATYKQIAARLGTSICRVPQILGKLQRKYWRQLKNCNEKP